MLLKKSTLLAMALALLSVTAVSAVAQEAAEEDFSVTPTEGTYQPYDPAEELVAVTGVLLLENQCGAGHYITDEASGVPYFAGAYDEYLWPGPDGDVLAGYDGQYVTLYGILSENEACGPYMTVYWVEPAR